MIHAVAWFSPQYCGVLGPGGKSWEKSSPDLSDVAQATALIGLPVKYFSRMTLEARYCLCAASMALDAAQWTPTDHPEIGLIAAGFAGVLEADRQYFTDYVANGRSIGRGNLFIYTLPTSALGEVAIPLKLTGPMLHVHGDAKPVGNLFRTAQRLVADKEASGILALWSDLEAAVCFAVGSDPCPGGPPAIRGNLDISPVELTRHLKAMLDTELGAI